jgi:hypothetical protein
MGPQIENELPMSYESNSHDFVFSPTKQAHAAHFLHCVATDVIQPVSVWAKGQVDVDAPPIQTTKCRLMRTAAISNLMEIASRSQTRA